MSRMQGRIARVVAGRRMDRRRVYGTFVLANSTLLDGHDATTSWWLAPMFSSALFEHRLDESRMLVTSGAFVTAGAALAHIDLALGLIRRQRPGASRAYGELSVD